MVRLRKIAIKAPMPNANTVVAATVRLRERFSECKSSLFLSSKAVKAFSICPRFFRIASASAVAWSVNSFPAIRTESRPPLAAWPMAVCWAARNAGRCCLMSARQARLDWRAHFGASSSKAATSCSTTTHAAPNAFSVACILSSWPPARIACRALTEVKFKSRCSFAAASSDGKRSSNV
jgi:hypothetical protein